jgi:hypothetical protein
MRQCMRRGGYRPPRESSSRCRWRRHSSNTDGFRLGEWRRMNVRKKDKRGDAMGRASWGSSFLGDPGTKFFCGKRGTGRPVRCWPTFTGTYQDPQIRRKLCEVFLFLLFLPSGAGCGGPQRSRPALFWRGGSVPLTVRTAAKESAREEKILFSRMQELCNNGGTHDE